MADVDLFLLIFVLVVVAMAVVVNTKILLHFQMPEGSGFSQSIFVKSVVVISLTLSWLVNLLLPIDVRNSRPEKGVLDMQILWSVAFITLAVFLVIIVPATMLYYEVEDDEVVRRKRRHVMCHMFFVLIFVVCGVSISYAFFAKADLPVQEYACDQWIDGAASVKASSKICTAASSEEIRIRVGFHIYLIAAMCWIGWWGFITFGGIGLSAIPIDLIYSYIDRPTPIDERTFQDRKRMVGAAAVGMLKQAEQLKEMDTELQGLTSWKDRRRKRGLMTAYNRFKKDVHLLDDEFERLFVSKFRQGEHPLLSCSKLLLGILFAIISILWMLHIMLYVAPEKPISPFLNDILTSLETGGMYPLGVTVFALFNLYLLACVVCGACKFGMRIFIFFAVHPMKYKATPLNSILFNTLLIMLSSAAVVQFSQTAFSDYARMTDADVIFAAQIKHLEFFRYFFKHNIFIYTLMGWFFLTLIYLIWKPRDPTVVKFNKKVDKKVIKMGAGAEGTNLL